VIQVSASIGITPVAAGISFSSLELMRSADVAMYAAKASGRGRFAVHDPALMA
jgi:GGDEF domain-containing protein